MIKCLEPACDNLVSDQALMCPRCGCEIRKVQYKFLTVTHHDNGASDGGDEYRALLKDGWQVIDERQDDLYNDDGRCYAVAYRYKLQK
jgi:hypothetical protein